jgi:hypothetical protein
MPLIEETRIKLHHIFADCFSDGELRTLCFYLEVEYDSLPGDGKADKARELIAYLERRRDIPRLVKVGRQLRPDIDWGKFEVEDAHRESAMSRQVNADDLEIPIVPIIHWVIVKGKWELKGPSATYVGPDEPIETDKSLDPCGLILSKTEIWNGIIETTVNFMGNYGMGPYAGSAAYILFGYTPSTKEYYIAGLGGHDRAYVLYQFRNGTGWIMLDAEGKKSHLDPQADYCIRARVQHKSKVSLIVNDVTVLEHDLPEPVSGGQIGLFAWGYLPIEFKDTKVSLKTLYGQVM